MQNEFKPDDKGYPFNPFSYIDNDGQLHQEVTLPDYKKHDNEMRERLAERYEVKKNETIKNNSMRKNMNMNIVKVVAYVVALIAAYLFSFIFPGSGYEEAVITVVAAVVGAVGLKDWRDKYYLFKEWYKSKTKIGAAITAIGIVLAVGLPFLFTLPAWLVTVLMLVASFGGGTALLGIFDAIVKKNSNQQLKL